MGWGIVYPPYSILNMGTVQPPTPTTRWAYNFNGVDQYVVLPDIPIPDDGFFMSGKFRPKSLTGNQTIFWGGIVDFQFGLQGSTEARLSWFNGTQHAALISGLTLEIDEEYTFTIETLGASGIRLTLGGAQAINSDAVSLQALVSEQQLGRRNSGEFFNGLVYDVLINDGSVYNYPINDRTFGPGAVIANSATVLGSELLFNNDFSSQGSGWNVQDGVSFANGLLVYDGVKNDVIWQNVNVEANTTYIFEIKVINVIRNGGNQPRVQIANGGYLPVRAVSDGVYRVLLESSVNGSNPLYIELGAFGAGAAFSVDYVSLKKADGYATGVNLLESGWTEINI